MPQMWSGVSDEMLVPDAALPSQFADIWHRTRAISPERALALAVLQEAVVDLEKYRFATRRRQQRLFWEAYQWIASNDQRWPFSYVNLCELIGMDPDSARKRLLGEMAPPRSDDYQNYLVEAA
ncbi:MAG: hypothetical protein ABI629_05975 [bacterium]